MSYPRIIDFGKCTLTNLNEGVANSILYSRDAKIGYGPGPVDRMIGISNQNNMAYMSERCAGNWDGYCEIAYLGNDNDYDGGYFPNTYKSNDGQCSARLGDSLLKNTGELRFLRFNGMTYQEPLDPLTAGSPMVTKFINRRTLCDATLTHNVNRNTIDNDPVMRRMLAKPQLNANTLRQIYVQTQLNKQRVMMKDGSGVPEQVLDGTYTGEMLQRMFGRGVNRGLQHPGELLLQPYGVAQL